MREAMSHSRGQFGVDRGLMSGWGLSEAASGVRARLLPRPGPGSGARLGRCCPSACVYLQSEAETLQLDGARVLELCLLTVLGAWPVPGSFPSHRQAACGWRPPTQSRAERGAICVSDPGRGSVAMPSGP